MSSEAPLVNPVHPDLISKLDPQFVEIYNKYQAPHLRADQVEYAVYNADRAKYSFPIATGPMPEVGSVTLYKVKVDKPAGEILAQVYYPTEEAIKEGGLKTADGKLPVHMNIHGGGWVIGSLKSDEPWCRQACQRVGCAIVNVDYRMAPEFPHPTQVWDCWAVMKWVVANAEMLKVDITRMSVGGGSAGGHLSAVTALLARDDPEIPPLKLQLLVVPATDARYMPIEGSADPSVPYETYITCEYAPCLPLHRMVWFHALWLGKDPETRYKLANDWLASPILAPSHANLAPAFFTCAEYDVLTAEGVAYHNLLTKAGTPSRLKIYPGVCHPFAHWDGELDKAKEWVNDTVAALKEAYKL